MAQRVGEITPYPYLFLLFTFLPSLLIFHILRRRKPQTKVNKIRQIVRLKQILKKWKNASLRCRSFQFGPNDSDLQSGLKWKCTPSGTLPVYVGAERRRFVIPTQFLNLPVFVALLNQAVEEFGYRTNGGLTLLCDVNFFEVLLEFLERDEERFRELSLAVISGGLVAVTRDL